MVIAAAKSSPTMTSSVSSGRRTVTTARMAVDHEMPIAHNEPLRIAYRTVDSTSPLRALSTYDIQRCVVTGAKKVSSVVQVSDADGQIPRHADLQDGHGFSRQRRWQLRARETRQIAHGVVAKRVSQAAAVGYDDDRVA